MAKKNVLENLKKGLLCCYLMFNWLNFFLCGSYLLVVVVFPFTTRVEVETDLKLAIPPPMLSIPSRPPNEVEKELNSTVKRKKRKI